MNWAILRHGGGLSPSRLCQPRSNPPAHEPWGAHDVRSYDDRRARKRCRSVTSPIAQVYRTVYTDSRV